MLYYKYKNGNGYISCQDEPADTSLLITISKKEYDKYMASIAPTKEQVRANKKARLKALMKELYPKEG